MLLDDARAVLEQAEQLRVKVRTAAGTATVTVGILADSAEQAGTALAVPLADMPPSRLVVAWTRSDDNSRVRSFVDAAVRAFDP